MTTYFTCLEPVFTVSQLQSRALQCSKRYHVDIPTSAQRPCCSAPNLVCDQQHILTVQRACRHFNLTQDTGTWSRKCRVYDVCHEDVSKPLTSDQSVVMTIRLVNAYYMYNVELLGLIERSVMCSRPSI